MEVSENARVLITASYQAFARIDVNDKDTSYFNILISIFFLGIYLEESIDHIIHQMNCKYDELIDFVKPYRPNLLNEFVWYYNEFITRNNKEPKQSKGDIYFNKNLPATMEKIENEFEGFTAIYEFRNNIAHGDLDITIERIKSKFTTVADVDALRICAKKITERLVSIAQDSGYKHIKKDKTFPPSLGTLSRFDGRSSQ